MINIERIFFIDIETTPQTATLDELPQAMRQLWTEKFSRLQQSMPGKYASNISENESFLKNAGIYAEFGRVICISVGVIRKGKLRIKSFAGHDEHALLAQFAEMISKKDYADYNFCGHNIKEFDIPYICRRMLINGIALPSLLQINAKKPWEVNLLDTMDFWKFGDYKNYTSLKLLSTVFNIPTSKDDIDGSEVSTVYYVENNLARIVVYCQKDVIVTTRVWLRMNGHNTIADEEIEYR